jgi:acyl-coenzyme A thioesterase PaaI-like protein
VTTSRITVLEFEALVKEGFPTAPAGAIEMLALQYGEVVLRSTTNEGNLRPGGTVSGPALFAIADLAMYALVLSVVGNVPLAVTTDATVHFLRKPSPGALIARARLLKGGKRLVVGDVVLASEGEDGGPVVHAVMTYAVPG